MSESHLTLHEKMEKGYITTQHYAAMRAAKEKVAKTGKDDKLIPPRDLGNGRA